jgi:peptide/nickel transport system ATP-binding protein
MTNVTTPILSVRDLTVTFATREGLLTAVNGVSFDVGRGEVLGLVGESGSGKSVTGLAILGLIDAPGRVASGSIRLSGEELTTRPEAELRALRGKRVAMIFQDPMNTLNPVLRIDTQMIEAIRAHERVSHKAARDRARQALASVGIPSPDERLDAYPFQFSGGMRQRVAIATALLNRPALLVADEPTTALDVTIQAQVLELIRELKERLHMAMLLITHDLGVVAESAERVVVMYAGRKVEEGAVREMFRKPHHPYTEGLIKVSRWESSGGGEMPEIPCTVPSPVELPPGCSFAPRCAYAMPACSREQPPLFDLADGRSSACFLAKADRP